jgi:hypothetical protein
MTPDYQLQRFEELFDEWVGLERPDADLRIRVLDWIFTRIDRPYDGARREATLPNLWYAVVPGSLRGTEVVVCSFWIWESDRQVRCDRIATLTWPV